MSDDWLRPRPDARGYRADAIAAVLLAAGSAISAALYTRLEFYSDPAELWQTILLIAFLTLPLAARRRYPEAVAVIISIAFFLSQQLRVPELLFCNITLFIAIHSVGAWSRHRRVATYTRIAIIAGMFVWIGVNLIVNADNPRFDDYSRSGVFSQFASLAIIQIIQNLLYFAGAYYFGSTTFRAARERAELIARTAELAAERELSAQQAVALDRVRIARELHDVVAHHVSVMGVQAGAARRVLLTDPGQASASLSSVEQSARTAVDELHKLLTTLREDGSDAASAHTSSSTRGIDQLADLVAECTAAGTPATLQVVGEPRPVTALTGFTVYRVAQESLTNVRKHAGDRATADVRLRYLPNGIELEVADTGGGTGLAGASNAGSGLGHAGMRERLAAVGGTLEVGRRSRGGYLLRARIVTAEIGGTS